MAASKSLYVATTKVIKNVVESAHPTEVCILIDVVNGLAEVFKNDNPKFNRELFVKACGL